MARLGLAATSVRFVGVGISNVVLGFVVYWTCWNTPLELPYKAGLSQLTSYALGTWWSFYWNRRWTFRSQGPVVRQAFKFVTLQVVLGVLSAAMISLAVDTLGRHPAGSWVAVMSLITVLNYALSRFWAFQ
jgi:putative flippase GtrA